MEMSSWWPMPKVVGLTTYTDQRTSSSCADSVSMEECERVVLGSKWHNWYYADLMFGQNSIIFLCVGLGVFTLANIVFRLKQHKYGRGLGNDPIYIWLAGLSRFAGSRQWRLSRRRGYTLTLGQSMTISLLILFFSVMTLAPKPYYWPDLSKFGGSPPIATRSGYMAIAILPFQVLLATKWNLITCLTGVSHEKLQVFHRWMGWIMYVLALIHTFPFIIVDRKLGMMDMIMQTDWYTVSGIITLVPQTLLVSLSIAPIRNRAYELFKGIHFILAAFFIVFLFLHCGFTMTSALYFVGLAAAYSFSFLIRLLILIRNGSPIATLTLSSSSSSSSTSAPSASLVLITIPTSTSSRLHWKAGQHYFVRFLTENAHMFSSHPFTAASAPEDGRLEFVIKPAKGMTRALMSKVQRAGQTSGTGSDGREMEVRVLLDGPYGGIGGDIGCYDRVLLVAGGSGISFLLGTLSHLTHQPSLTARHVSVIYTSRDAELAEHYRTTLTHLAARLATAHAHTRVETFCHLSSLSPASPDWDPEQAALVSEMAIAEDRALEENDVPAAKLEDASPCCCDSVPIGSERSSEKRSSNDIQPVALDKQKKGDGSDSDSSYSRSSVDVDRSGPAVPGVNASLRSGRSNMRAHICRLTTQYGTAAIAICGPKELVYDARNAVADEQLKIVRGDTACTDLYLHTELFEW